MKSDRHTYILIVILAFYLLIHFAQAHAVGPAIIRFYAKDIILIPLLLLGINLIAPLIQRPIIIGGKETILSVAYASIVFEGIMPMLKPQLKADWIDVLLYALGGLVYHLLSKQKNPTISVGKVD